MVTANLQEFKPYDVSRIGDMEAFVRRLLLRVPTFPDVLLLQEVNRKATRVVRSLLHKKTNKSWRTAVGAAQKAFWPLSGGKTSGSDTAILINQSTMTEVAPGGYFRTRYGHRQAAPGSRVKIKKHAHTLLA